MKPNNGEVTYIFTYLIHKLHIYYTFYQHACVAHNVLNCNCDRALAKMKMFGVFLAYWCLVHDQI